MDLSVFFFMTNRGPHIGIVFDFSSNFLVRCDDGVTAILTRFGCGLGLGLELPDHVSPCVPYVPIKVGSNNLYY